jgi:hypothetical protein
VRAFGRGTEWKLVRYEDLISDLGGVASRLGAWLEVDLEANQVHAQRDRYRQHMTSPTAEASIGRWHRDLDSSEAERITRAMATTLAALGYSV